MSKNLRDQIASEIARVKSAVDEQKAIVKRGLNDPRLVETAELEMKALHARLSVLEANLAKAPDQQPDAGS